MAEQENNAQVGKDAELVAGEPPEQPAGEVETAPEPEPQAEEAPQQAENSIAQKRGRMVMAAAVVAVVLSVIAVLVAGIFGLTSRWLTVCPTDLRVNDPAPVLWQKLEAASIGGQSLGVEEKLVSETGFKGRTAERNDANK